MSDPQWFYADESGTQRGPVTAAFLQAVFAQGQLRADDLVWREGMADWLRYAEVAELEAGSTPTYAPPPLSHPAGLVFAAHARQEIVYAGFWRRYLALMLDSLILGLPLVLLAVMLVWMAGVSGLSSGTPSPLTGLAYLVYWIAAPLYYALQESSGHQATLGKRALGIKVTDRDGRRLSFGNALGRWFAAILSYLTLYIGFLMAAFTQRRQALHDIVADTLVVDRWAFTDHPERQKTGLSGCLIAFILVVVLGIPVLGILAAIAIPAYQDYAIRAKVSEAINISASPKLGVEESFAQSSRCPSNAAEAGLAPENLRGQYLSSLTVGTMQSGHCGIEIVVSNTGRADVDGKRIWLELQPGQSERWTCSSEIPARYLPAKCRQ
jgi:uncharacterized RDD family membrane protein YckC/Tfp pilus assembly protein PilE